MIKQEICQVIDQREIATNIYELTVKGELVHEMTEPGQFVHVKVNNSLSPLLRRPISIANIDQSRQTFTMIYRAEGKGTSLLAKLKQGDLLDVLGPLGHGFPVDEVESCETALLVGGGIGVPPLYELSQRLTANGVNVIHVLGFQTKNAVFYEEEFKQLGATYITTADGSYAYSGLVTVVIKNENITFDVLYTCGPTPMLRALEKENRHKKVFLSLEERMGCGIGACFACVCHTGDDPTGVSYKKVCSDGPVFRAGEVVI